MNCLLLEGALPERIDGVTIYPDYRNMIRFEGILSDDHLTDEEKTLLGVRQLFEELPPGGMARAVDRLQWFYLRGRELTMDSSTQSGKKTPRAYDVCEDAESIYAGFLQAYRIDLIGVPYLHWWAFLALLENLPDGTLMAQKMQLRTLNLDKIKDKELRKQYAALKKQVALPEKQRSSGGKGLKERLQQRFAQVSEAQRRDTHV